MANTQALNVQPAGFDAAVEFVIGLAERPCARMCNFPRSPYKTVAVSPAGLAAALALLTPGARGAAGAALSAGLDYDPDEFERMLRDAYNKSTGEAEVLMARALWASMRLKLQADYLARLQEQDGDAEIRPIELGADTIAAITSAVYFKAAWALAFHPALTQPGTFNRSRSVRLKVPMMRREGSCLYCEGPSFQAVCLYFAGYAWQAIIAVDRDGGTALANPSTLEFAARKGLLVMPRLSFETAAELTGALKENGLADVVSRRADFSGIADQAFHLDSLRQSIAMSADETGVEAAAATIARARPRFAGGEPPPFTMLVDRPFLFALRHRATGLLLFAAKVCDPRTDKTDQR